MTGPDAGAIVTTLLLLGAANGAPVFTTRLLGPRLGWPVDGGIVLPDGRALFGASKTWRGLFVSVAATALAAALLGHSWAIGAAVAAVAMAGDLLSSFLKRRLGRPPHTQCLGLDQLPESVLPMLVLRGPLGLWWFDIAVASVAFVVLELALSRALFALGIRDRPY